MSFRAQSLTLVAIGIRNNVWSGEHLHEPIPCHPGVRVESEIYLFEMERLSVPVDVERIGHLHELVFLTFNHLPLNFGSIPNS